MRREYNRFLTGRIQGAEQSWRNRGTAFKELNGLKVTKGGTFKIQGAEGFPSNLGDTFKGLNGLLRIVCVYKK